MQARTVRLLAALLLCGTGTSRGVEWLRPGLNSDKPLWGVASGLRFGIYPGSVTGRGDGGPRGLIRLGYPSLPGGRCTLINFIAVEPIVNGRRGFSELEISRLDGVAGKRFWVNSDSNEVGLQPGARGEFSVSAAKNQVKPGHAIDPGKLWRPTPQVEQLDVTLRIERFDNGAHVYLRVSQRSDAPDEVRLSVHAEPDSAPMDACVLTATMGNMTRARQLWLKDDVVTSLKLYPNYRDVHFAPHAAFPLARLKRTATGDVVVAITGDEDNPAAAHPFPGTDNWYYGGFKVTQYWRVPAGSVADDLAVVVNGRFTYWRSHQAVPGGIAFENFEIREHFREGQAFDFGITGHTPRELGW
jgi:hypothetical protein